MHRRSVTVSGAAGSQTGETEAAGATEVAAAESNDAKDADNEEVVGAKGSDVSKADASKPDEDTLEVDAVAAAAASLKVGVEDFDFAADSKAFLKASKGLGAATAAFVDED